MYVFVHTAEKQALLLLQQAGDMLHLQHQTCTVSGSDAIMLQHIAGMVYRFMCMRVPSQHMKVSRTHSAFVVPHTLPSKLTPLPVASSVLLTNLHGRQDAAMTVLGDRELHLHMQAYTAEKESPLLLQQEFQRVQVAPAAPDMDNFSLKANPITREVVAVMEIEDGAVLEMVIKLPASSPLKRAEVTCRRRVRHLYYGHCMAVVLNIEYCAVL